MSRHILKFDNISDNDNLNERAEDVSNISFDQEVKIPIKNDIKQEIIFAEAFVLDPLELDEDFKQEIKSEPLDEVK